MKMKNKYRLNLFLKFLSLAKKICEGLDKGNLNCEKGRNETGIQTI